MGVSRDDSLDEGIRFKALIFCEGGRECFQLVTEEVHLLLLEVLAQRIHMLFVNRIFWKKSSII